MDIYIYNFWFDAVPHKIKRIYEKLFENLPYISSLRYTKRSDLNKVTDTLHMI